MAIQVSNVFRCFRGLFPSKEIDHLKAPLLRGTQLANDMPLQCLGFLTFGFFLSFCLCSTAPLPCSFCVCLFFALRVLCFFNLIPICEPHLHINPIGGVVRGPLFFCEILQPAAQCDQLALSRFARVFVFATVLPTAEKVHFPDLNLRPSRFPTVFLLFPGSLPGLGDRAIEGAVAVWNLAGC